MIPDSFFSNKVEQAQFGLWLKKVINPVTVYCTQDWITEGIIVGTADFRNESDGAIVMSFYEDNLKRSRWVDNRYCFLSLREALEEVEKLAAEEIKIMKIKIEQIEKNFKKIKAIAEDALD